MALSKFCAPVLFILESQFGTTPHVGLGDKMATQSIIKGIVYVEGKAGHGAESWEGFLWEPHWTLKGREIWVLQEGSS